MVPLPVEVADTPKQDKGPKFQNDQVKILLQVFEGPYSQITIEDPVTHLPKQVPGRMMVYMNLTMSPTTSGQKSMLRQFVEAIYGPLTDDQAYALDLEELKGQRAVMVGNYANPNAEVLRLKPIGFSSYVAGQVGVPIATPGAPPASAFQPPAAQPVVAPAPVSGPLAPNGELFERIENGHGLWLNPVTQAYEWVLLPSAPPAPPPPPPPTAVVVPPPPPPPPAAAPVASPAPAAQAPAAAVAPPAAPPATPPGAPKVSF